METIHHYYRPRWFFRSYTIFFDVFGLCFPLIPISAFSYNVFANPRPITLSIIAVALLYTLILWVFATPNCLLAGNFFLEITSDSDGLHAPFLWKRLDISWADIVAVKPVKRFSWKKRTLAIQVRKHTLTPFHLLCGLAYTFSFYPCITYDKTITNEKELSRRIAAAIQQNQSSRMIEPIV